MFTGIGGGRCEDSAWKNRGQKGAMVVSFLHSPIKMLPIILLLGKILDCLEPSPWIVDIFIC